MKTKDLADTTWQKQPVLELVVIESFEHASNSYRYYVAQPFHDEISVLLTRVVLLRFVKDFLLLCGVSTFSGDRVKVTCDHSGEVFYHTKF
jgi:hypothetical protein